MAAPRLLRVRCTTWDQVEAFYRRKLRRSGRLAMRVPFDAAVGDPVTLALELPNQIVIAVDGAVSAVGEGPPGRVGVEVTLFAMTSELLAQLEAMVGDSREAGGGNDDDDERRLLVQRQGDLRRMRQLPAHELLGVPRDPSAVELRAAWLAVARREHPDFVARLASPVLSAAAEDGMTLVTRAYDLIRREIAAEGRGAAIAAVVRPPGGGWTVGVDELAGASGFFAEAVTPPVDDAAVAGTPPVNSEVIEVEADEPPPPAKLDVHSAPTVSDLDAVAAAAVASAAMPDPGEVESKVRSFAAGTDAPPVELPPPAPTDGGRPNSAAEELSLPPVQTPVPPGHAVAVRFGSPSDLFSDLDLGVPVAGAAPIAVEESLGMARSGPGDRFVRQVRERLGAGDHDGARQIAEAALHVYAADRRLRGLQHVAIAMAACARNDRLGAVAALETALAHDPGSGEAAAALDQLRRAVTPTVLAIQRLFR